MTYDNTFEYTHEFTVRSSLIDEVLFNENNNTVVLDVNDELYRYSGVTREDVAALVDANSVGAHYNTNFKKTFGPSEHLGRYDVVEALLVDLVTPKNLYVVASNGPVAPTKEFSLHSEPEPVFDHSVSGSPVSYVGDVPTKEFSLSGPAASPDVESDNFLDGVSEVVVHFTLDAYGSRKFKFVATSEDVAGAIAELHDYVSKIELTGRVTKVVTKF